MRHRGGAQRTFQITPNAHHEPVDQNFLHRFSTEIPLHETTKIRLANQQVTERRALAHYYSSVAADAK